jgi:hypothetical protein
MGMVETIRPGLSREFIDWLAGLNLILKDVDHDTTCVGSRM